METNDVTRVTWFYIIKTFEIFLFILKLLLIIRLSLTRLVGFFSDVKIVTYMGFGFPKNRNNWQVLIILIANHFKSNRPQRSINLINKSYFNRILIFKIYFPKSKGDLKKFCNFVKIRLLTISTLINLKKKRSTTVRPSIISYSLNSTHVTFCFIKFESFNWIIQSFFFRYEFDYCFMEDNESESQYPHSFMGNSLRLLSVEINLLTCQYHQ